MSAARRPVVLFGTGQAASVAYAVLMHDSPYTVVAFTVDEAFLSEQTFLGLPVVPFEAVEQCYPPATFGMHIAIGDVRVNRLRAERYEQARAKGYELITYVSRRAITWPDLSIGDNCWIMDNSVVQPYTTIGNNVYIGGSSHVGHHVTVEDHAFIAGCVAIPGAVRIGAYSFIGMGAALRHGVTIARECIVGAGAVILRDTREKGVYVAPPAVLLPTPSDAVAYDLR
jgi:sugar O-acyltransferase (sialic acid O-acetyltransferase NeuD family)